MIPYSQKIDEAKCFLIVNGQNCSFLVWLFLILFLACTFVAAAPATLSEKRAMKKEGEGLYFKWLHCSTPNEELGKGEII